MYIIVLEIFGGCLIFRCLVGPLWFVELYLSLTWIFTLSATARDEMGRAMERPSVRHVVSNSIVASVIFYIAMVMLFEPLRYAGLLTKISILFAVTITASIFGSLLGILRGLPVSPQILLTTWPTEGFSFVNERCVIKPHTWAKLFGGGMNSFQFHILQLKRQQEFRLLISGSNDFEDAMEARRETDR